MTARSKLTKCFNPRCWKYTSNPGGICDECLERRTTRPARLHDQLENILDTEIAGIRSAMEVKEI